MKIVSTSFVRFLTVFISAYVLILSARSYGPAGRGVIAASITTVTLAATLGGMSLGRVLVFMIAEGKVEPREFYRQKLVSILLLMGILLVTSLSLLGVAYLVRPSLFGQLPGSYLAIMLVAFPYYLWTTSSSFIFASLGELMSQNRITALNRVALFAVSSLGVLLCGLGLTGFVAVLALFSLMNFLCELGFLLRLIRPLRTVDRSFLRALLKNGASVHLDTVGGIFIASSNILIINYYRSPADVGVFEFATQIVTLLTIIPSVVQLFINSEIAASGPDAAWAAQKRLMARTMLFIAAAVLAAYFLLPVLVPLATGKTFLPALPVINLLLVSVLGNSFAILMGPQWSGRGHFKSISALTLAIGSTGLAAALFLVPRIGIEGAAYAALLNYALALAVNVLFYLHIERGTRAQGAACTLPEGA